MVPCCVFERLFQYSGIPLRFPERWSDLFSCPLSLAGISKDHCLLISKGTAGYLQVLDESASPLLHNFPILLPLRIDSWNMSALFSKKNTTACDSTETVLWIFEHCVLFCVVCFIQAVTRLVFNTPQAPLLSSCAACLHFNLNLMEKTTNCSAYLHHHYMLAG